MSVFADINAGPLSAALALLPAAMESIPARLMVLSIGGQESDYETRQQRGGPGRSYWQFERGGGVHGVLTHKASAWHALQVCNARGVAPNADAVYAAMLTDDVLGAAFARLLLWTDPYPLPAIGDEVGAWLLYLRTWRPGMPRRDRWRFNYVNATEVLQ